MAAGSKAVSGTIAVAQRDDMMTVSSIAVLCFMVDDVLHEGLGHACTALLTVSPSGLLTTVAWSSAYDSRLVDAAGTLVNLAAAAVFWLLLRSARRATVQTRLFLLICLAFNLFSGTGYFFFSGVTNFGDWAGVIDGLQPHAMWRAMLIVVGFAAYWTAAVWVGKNVVRYLGIARSDGRRFFRMMLTIYLSAIAISTLGGLMNPMGFQYVLFSAVPATVGANCGLLWMRYYIPGRTTPLVEPAAVTRSWAWSGAAAAAALIFIFVLGRGIMLHR